MIKKLVALLLVVCLIGSFVPLPGATSIAQAATVPVKVLEITDSGTSDLSSVLSTSSYTIETVSMKKFVSLRTELDGKYDAIYIGKGQYNPESLGLLSNATDRTNASKSKGILNDITSLKANQIIESYINKGLLVLIYSDAATQSGLLYQGKVVNKQLVPNHKILYNTFSPYKDTNKKSNVVFIDAAGLTNLRTTLVGADYSSMLNQRPQLELKASPIDYKNNNNNIYQAGDTLTYNYAVGNASQFSQSGLTANLYLGLDQSLKYTADQIVASSSIDGPGGTGTISYRLPKGFSGLYYWRLEIADQSSKLKNYVSGTIRFRDKQTSVNVLQVMPDGDKNSSLKNTNVLKQSYLESSDYKITLDTTDFKTFNATTYQTINGTYDMLIFGFRDSYNGSANISDNAANAVNNFIKTGQSVMFTHDTVFSSSETGTNNWIKYFQGSTGQTGTKTNIGFGAPIPSTQVQQINEGLLTQFPFDLKPTQSTPIAVANTHDQYFMLNLEDEDITPWYNIIGSDRDPDDSYNHYYTYSKGNVTYSGSGHVFTGGSGSFPDWEQKLFVNTMYRAYMGSNHAPDLTVLTPEEYTTSTDNFIPHYQDVVVSFIPDDYDLTDRTLNATVALKQGDTVLSQLPVFKVDSGSTVTKSFTNPLPNGGDLTIEVSVTDKSGAKTVKTVKTKVKKITANLQVNRSVSGLTPDGKASTGNPLTITYTASPQLITLGANGNSGNLVISTISFNEKFPANLEISGLPSGFTKNGSLSTGYTVTGTLSNVQYTRIGTTNQYNAPDVSFTITVVPKVDGSYLLNSSRLTFKDIGQSNTTTLPFQPIVFEAWNKITSLNLNGAQIAVNDEIRLIPTYAPANATRPIFTWTSSDPSVAPVNEIGTIKGLKIGRTIITVRDQYSGLTASAAVDVVPTGFSITGNKILNKDKSQPLTAILTKTESETVISKTKWTVTSADGQGQAALASQESPEIGSPWTNRLIGNNPGKVTVTATVTVKQQADGTEKEYKASYEVTIIDAKIQLDGRSTLIAGPTDRFEPYTITWISDSSVPNDIKNTVKYQWKWAPDPVTSATTHPEKTDTGNVTTNNLITHSIETSSGDRGKLIASVITNEGTVVATAEKPLTIIDQPSIEGRPSVLIGTENQLTLKWPTGVTPPEYTTDWVTNPVSSTVGRLTDKQNSGTKFTGTGAGKVDVVATITIKETGQQIQLPPKTITVEGANLILTGIQQVVEGDTTKLQASWSTDLSPDIQKDIKYDWKWNGDSTVASVDTSNKTSSNTLRTSKAGSGTVTVKATRNGEEIATTPPLAIEVIGKPNLALTGPAFIIKGSTSTTNPSKVELVWPKGIPSNTNPFTVTWNKGNDGIAFEGNGNVGRTIRGVKAGSTSVTASIRMGNTGYSFTTPAVNIPVVSIDLPSSVSVRQNEEIKLGESQLTVLPSKYKDEVADKLTWKSSDSSVVSVDPSTGKIIGKKRGDATVTVNHPDGWSYTIKVTVTSSSTDRY